MIFARAAFGDVRNSFSAIIVVDFVTSGFSLEKRPTRSLKSPTPPNPNVKVPTIMAVAHAVNRLTLDRFF